MTTTISGDTGLTAPVGAVYNGLQSGTTVASTSGTSIDFTSIPSWVKRITVMFAGVSTSGSSLIQIQLGSSVFTTSGYLGAGLEVNGGSAPNVTNNSTGFLIEGAATSASIRHGSLVIANISGNSWVSNGVFAHSETNQTMHSGGSVSLTGTLDRIRITTVNGTDTFDAGSINILYE